MKKRFSFFVKNKVGTRALTSRIRKKICPTPKRSQVWVETVIYTLIAFVMIGLVLTFAKPQIEKLQDKTLIDQSITMLKEIESTILNIGCSGNKRILELGIKKGELRIDGINDMIIFEMESRHTYSEPGEKIETEGNIFAFTETKGNVNIVNLTRDYSSAYNLQYDGENELEILSKSSVPYKLLLKNEGEDENNKIIINIIII
ncbi:hypothetical protein KAT24_02790 [Candidatus Pacearchaeota archaeon]|nr:hypothetical protein [Candidatus Pacearchaeota archaeon]